MAVEHLDHVDRLENAAHDADSNEALASALPLAGFALAHAALSVESSDSLVTLAAVAEGGELRRLIRFPAGRVEDSVRSALKHLAGELDPGGQAALVYGGYVKLSKRKGTHALIVELMGPRGVDLGRIVQPYRRRRLRIPVLGYVRGFSIRGRLIIDHLLEQRDLEIGNAEARIYTGVWDHPAGPRLFGRARSTQREG
jgi:hypothetical protein